MTYAVSFAKKNTITPDNLPHEIRVFQSPEPGILKGVRELELDIILRVVDNAKSMEDAARQLGISRSTLYRRLRR